MPEIPVPPPPEIPAPAGLEPPATILERVAKLEAYVLRNDARITALETDVDEKLSEVGENDDVVARLEWAVKHGRQRPW